MDYPLFRRKLVWATLPVFLLVALSTSASAKSLSLRKRDTLSGISFRDESLRPLSSSQVSSTNRRQKRTLLSPLDVMTIVDLHNSYRRKVPASNMEYLSWNSYLAELASTWANQCLWYHGQPSTLDPSLVGYNYIGQNIFAETGLTTNRTYLTNSVLKWYEEGSSYDYETMACSIDDCGHYTQVVWATTTQIGCAMAYCPVLANQSSIIATNANYVVCNYGPAGNINNIRPYLIGNSCSNCSSGYGWCHAGLCTGVNCISAGPNCTCNSECRNCSTVDCNNCKCSCANGFTGPDCSVKCQDYSPYCGATPIGYPVEECFNETYKAAMDHICPALCGVCVKDGTCNDPSVRKCPTAATSTVPPTTSRTTTIITTTSPKATTPTTTTTSTTLPTTTTITSTTIQPTTTAMPKTTALRTTTTLTATTTPKKKKVPTATLR